MCNIVVMLCIARERLSAYRYLSFFILPYNKSSTYIDYFVGFLQLDWPVVALWAYARTFAVAV